MVQSALAIAENSRGVATPVSGVGRHAHWSFLDGGQQLIATLHCLDLADLEVSALYAAVLFVSLVGVLGLSGDAVVLHVGQTPVVESPVASLVAVFTRTVHQLLLRQQLSYSFLEREGLHDSHCTEGPTGTTAALVLDGRDHFFGSPVDVFVGSSRRHLDVPVVAQVRIATRTEVTNAEFLVSHGTELVDSHLVGLRGI